MGSIEGNNSSHVISSFLEVQIDSPSTVSPCTQKKETKAQQAREKEQKLGV